MKNLSTILVILCLVIKTSFAQKTIDAKRITDPITIDGQLNEAIWDSSDIASGFKTIDPQPGLDPTFDAQIRILYDDEAVYFGAFMPDASRDSISTQITERDDIGNTDFFGVVIDSYQGGNDAFQFILASTAVQFDAKRTPNNEDSSWDAVWEGAVELTDKGWYAEMKLPYAALRFPKKKIQEWNLNFLVRRAVSAETSLWNEIDPNQDNSFLVQMGTLTGLADIKTPLRLSFSPYGTAYYSHDHDPNDGDPISGSGTSYSLGMDLKYGINDAFTLDMILVPDFGQTRQDDQVVNLSAFEQYFEERRQFFTEGFELFDKGNAFYSRRVGSTPINMYSATEEYDNASYEILSNPNRQKLYNASKISGRNKNGLGIGIFNGVASATHAKIKNLESNEEFEVETAPLTNYNMMVVDQNLKNNSSVSLYNTNVWRNGTTYDANVTGGEFTLKNKSQSWGINGDFAVSQLLYDDQDNDVGHAYSFGVEKLQGNFVFGLNYNIESDNYNPNDMGFLRAPNERSLGFWANYRRNDGFGPFTQFNSWTNITYQRLHTPNVYANTHFNFGWWGQNKNQWNFNMWYNFRPKANDYFEPRTEGRHVEIPFYYNAGYWMGSDGRKKFRFTTFLFGYNVNEEGRHGYETGFNLRYRFTDRLSITSRTNLNFQNNDVGWTDFGDHDEIIFGKRDRRTVSNNLGANYAFSDKMFLDLSVRHYWAKVYYNEFFELNVDGSEGSTDYSDFRDFSFNAFNIDLRFRWRLAPGSDLIMVWQNSIFGSDSDESLDYRGKSYFNGLKDLNDYAQNNTLSVRLVYFLDYNKLMGSF